ncbi:cobaltochelatase subunit CobN [Methanolobus profundi]|uniref:Cobaltochelatase CobN subunit n=1 Tax=Methanolobus profundi TaxID=487685 RepID=A0A1I4UZH9_9EURY|nr:cobaltochelatase subunit CobN [Methanolobus profundi]SFM94306.1 cobaltochelatase CobN subunit [Methanolobus profundi]
MQIKIRSILVLSILLLVSLTSVAAADEEKINITYIAYKPSEALETASQTNPYSDVIDLTYINYYDSSKDPRVSDDVIEAAENGFFETQDVIFCTMVSGDAYTLINDSLKSAHDSGTSLLSIKTKLPTVPTYFDYRAYYEDANDIDANDTIAVYFNRLDTSGKGLENAENLLIYLATEYGGHPTLTANWGSSNKNYEEFLFILGTDFNKDRLITAASTEEIDLELNTTILSTDEVPANFNFSQYGVIFIGSQPEELVNTTWRSSINTARAAGAYVIGYNLSENITLTNVDLYSDDYTEIERYWIQGGETNMENMLKVMGQKFADLWTSEIYAPEILQPKMNVTYILNQDTSVYYLNLVLDEKDVITDRFNITVMNGEEAINNTDMDLTNEDVIILYMIGSNQLPLIKDELLEAQASGAQIGTFGMLSDVYGIATFDMESDENSILTDYLYNSGYSNMENWIRRVGATFGNVYIQYAEPAEPDIPTDGIYHPDAFPRIFTDSTEYLEWYADHGYNASAPTIGIIGGKFSQTELAFNSENAIIRELESQGCNVIYTTYTVCTDDVDYFIKDGEVLVDSIISVKGFYLNYGDQEEGVEFLQEVYNVPVLKAVQDYYQTPEDYINSTNGLSVSCIPWQVTQAEIDGLTDYIWIAGRVQNQTTEQYYYEPLDYQVEWLCNRAIAWAELGRTDNTDKKISILYYNHEGGKNNIGASYLDIGSSFTLLMDSMQNAGYDLGNNSIPNGSEFIDLFIESRNVGTWAPGELEKVVESGYVTMYPVEEYLEWYNTLPESVRDEVEGTWGTAPGEVMTYENESGQYFVIPTIQLGNINFIPQPTRAGLSDESLIYHNESIPPTHQYLATYFWINNEYDADALIHFGTHGTQEWLPGKEVGLWRYDYPSIMVAETPVIYPYIMDNVGEGTQAKRRGNAVIISHLTPPIVEAGLYGNLATMHDKIHNYEDAKDDENVIMMALYRNSTIQIYDELSLGEELDVSTEELSAMTDDDFEYFLDSILHNYLHEIQDELIPYGLHVFGVAPEDFKLVSMVKSMLGDDFKDHIYDVLSQSGGSQTILEGKASTDATLLLNSTLLYGANATDAQIEILGVTNETITSDLELAIEYADDLEETTREIDQTLKALNAEYIEPGTGNDPIRNPDALPTGTNFYSFDQRTIPDEETEAAGRAIVNTWLDSYYDENGEYPNKVAFILWSVETMRHEGLMEAQIYELLGVEPVRSSGRLTGEYNIIPVEELGHPRVDVLMIPSGLYRDTFPFQLELLDNAVRAVANLNETNETNYVRMNSLIIEDTMLESGYNETVAHYISRSRIFSEAPGTYGTGVTSAVEASDSWENTSEIADLFIARMSNIYGADVWGDNYEDVFKMNLINVDAAIHSDSSNLYGIADNDDYYQYLGGLGLAVRTLTGTAPSLFVADFTSVGSEEIITLSEAFNKELNARYLNELWQEGMMEYGYAGAREISKMIEYMKGWEYTTPDLVSDSDWNKLYDAYINNEKMSDFLKENPEIYQSIVADFVELDLKDSLDLTDEQRSNLINEYIDSVIESGSPACCHHTCGNLANQEYMLALAELYMEPDKVDQYKDIMAKSTDLDIYTSSEDEDHVQVTPDPELSISERHSGNSITRSMAASSTSNQTATTKTGMGENVNMNPEDVAKSTSDSYVEGYEMMKDTPSEETLSSSYAVSGSDIIASVLVIALLGAIYVGFWKRRQF